MGIKIICIYFFVKPLATSLALYLSIDLSNFNLFVKMHLHLIGFVPEGKLNSSRKRLLKMESSFLLTISFYNSVPLEVIASVKV